MANKHSDIDPFRLSSPRVFLLGMLVFLILLGLLAFILYQQIQRAFMANPGLNGLIIGVLLIGIIFSFRQVLRLFPEIAWVNGFRVGDGELTPGFTDYRSTLQVRWPVHRTTTAPAPR